MLHVEERKRSHHSNGLNKYQKYSTTQCKLLIQIIFSQIYKPHDNLGFGEATHLLYVLHIWSGSCPEWPQFHNTVGHQACVTFLFSRDPPSLLFRQGRGVLIPPPKRSGRWGVQNTSITSTPPSKGLPLQRFLHFQPNLAHLFRR